VYQHVRSLTQSTHAVTILAVGHVAERVSVLVECKRLFKPFVMPQLLQIHVLDGVGLKGLT